MKLFKIGEICDIVSSKRIFEEEYTDEGIPFIRGQEVSNGTINDESFNDFECYISELRYNEIATRYNIPHKGDILITAVGTIGNVVQLTTERKFYFKDGNILWLKNFTNEVDASYLNYYFQTLFFKKILNFSLIGAVQKALTITKLSQLEISLPELDYQKRISLLLSYIDAKIQNNKKQIETLESLAKSIYDYWFVQFDFPNEEGRPYKSSGGKMVWNEELKREIPEYWTVKNLSEVSDIVMGCSPKGDTINTEGDGLLFFQGASDFGNVYPIETAYTTAPIRIAKKGDLMISVRAPVGDINFTLTRCCIGRGLAAISTDKLSKSYLWCFLNNQKAHFSILNRIGTTFGCLSKNDLYKIKIVLPTKNVYINFISITEPLEKSIRLAHLENTNLTKLKSFLLPLLMNGQVTFKEAKEI